MMTVKQALAAQRKAERDVCEVVESRYPVGGDIAWSRGSVGRHCGKVTRHGYGARIEVRNQATGTTYWIHAYDIVEDIA